MQSHRFTIYLCRQHSGSPGRYIKHLKCVIFFHWLRHHFFNFQFYLAGFLFPLCGFTIASLGTFVCKQKSKDRFAIATETINFNTLIALSISKAVLPGTAAPELATLLAYLVVIMTPIPLFAQFIWNKIRFVYPNFGRVGCAIFHIDCELIPSFACVFFFQKT